MPVDLNQLTEGWLELESDPGLFTLLLEDFGVKGIQVEEIYDLQKPIEVPVYGFIFLFKWIEERRSRRKVIDADGVYIEDDKIVNSIFFAQQIVPNSCATHALLSVLLNCENIHLGETLTRLKDYTKNMTPENKGYAIVNTPELAKAHNVHAIPEPRRLQEKTHGLTTGGRHIEAFHFVSYVPINGNLFELDGLKKSPIDHGPWGKKEDWTEKFRRVITERLGIATGGEPYHDIRFNLMAVVPDRRVAYESKLRTLKTNRQIVLEALQQLVKITHPEFNSDYKADCMAAMARSDKSQGGDGSKDTCSSDVRVLESVLEGQAAVSGTPPPKNEDGDDSNDSYSLQHPALVIHNYAKSPLMMGKQGRRGSWNKFSDSSASDHFSDEENDSKVKTDGLNSESGVKVKIESSDSANPTGEHNPSGTEEVNASSSSDIKAPNKPESKVDPAAPKVPKTYSRGCKPSSSGGMLKPIHVNTDYTRPLSIQTKFDSSPTPSASSTDTASEVGSAFNSPVRPMHFSSGQCSPTAAQLKDIRKFVVIRVSGLKEQDVASPHHEDGVQDGEGSGVKRPGVGDESDAQESKRPCLEAADPDNQDRKCGASENASLGSGSQNACTPSDIAESSSDDNRQPPADPQADKNKYPQLQEPHNFAPKDLLALLKNIESEIAVCEGNLKDEMEKRKNYKIDDCRRTHNYDQFVCTFLSMLAKCGKINDLLDQHAQVKRRQGISVGRLRKDNKKVDKRRRRPPRPKPHKRK